MWRETTSAGELNVLHQFRVFMIVDTFILFELLGQGFPPYTKNNSKKARICV